MKIIVTGVAGFIGYHLAKALVSRGDTVLGIDNINDYYDVSIKYSRLKNLGIEKEQIEYNRVIKSSLLKNFNFIKLNLEDKKNLYKVFEDCKFDKVCNLAAQAGVRYSLTNPDAYISSNLVGFLNILECCRNANIKHLIYASTSSVYGLNKTQPLSEHAPTSHPISLYAATKKSNELMAHSYSYLYDIPTSGLRFFTVYGPWGRPDMALFMFTKAILDSNPIDIFNYGTMVRDFTYIDDIVKGTLIVIDNPPTSKEDFDYKNPDPAFSSVKYRIYNIGNSSPVKLMDFVDVIEKEIGKKAIKNMFPMQAGDVASTYADVKDLVKLGYTPSTTIELGVKNFIEWYKEYYGV